MVVTPTDNLEACKKYLEGIYMFNTQKFEFVFPGVEALKEAARLDPSFAAPYSYLSYTYTFMGLAGMLPLNEAIAIARRLCCFTINQHSFRNQLTMMSA